MDTSQLESLADYVRTNMRDTYHGYQETLEYNIQKRAFDMFPNAFTEDQQRVLQRIAEEVFRASEALCNEYSRTIIGALHEVRENFFDK